MEDEKEVNDVEVTPKRPSWRTKNAEKARNQRSERVRFARHVAGAKCKVCVSPVRDEICTAYFNWVKESQIAQEFGVPKRDIIGHADVFNWAKDRVANMTGLRVQLLGEAVDLLDLSKVPQKDLLEIIEKLARQEDRVQGRVIQKHQIDHNKSVTFISVPLPGGSAPVLPESKQKVLAIGGLVDAKWETNEEASAQEAPQRSTAGELPPAASSGTDAGGPAKEGED